MLAIVFTKTRGFYEVRCSVLLTTDLTGGFCLLVDWSRWSASTVVRHNDSRRRKVKNYRFCSFSANRPQYKVSFVSP